MKKVLLLIFFVQAALLWGETGIYESFIHMENDRWYDAQANTQFEEFHGNNLGSFDAGGSFLLKGGEIKTWKDNNDDVTGAFMYYRIYPAGATPGNFNQLNLPHAENLSTPGDQRWAKFNHDINVLAGLSTGNYKLEIYFMATTNEGDRYSNNGGANYIADFTVTQPVWSDDHVTVIPANPTRTEPITITLDATGTSLQDSAVVYLHSGLGTNQPGDRGFEYTVGNWGTTDGVGSMNSMGNNIWQIVIPSIDQYYNVPQNEDVFALNFLFRSASGAGKVDKGGANYHLPVQPGNYFLLENPAYSPYFTEINSSFDITATASSSVTWTLYETDATGTVLTPAIHTSNGNIYDYDHTLTDLNQHYFRLEADFGGETKFKTFEARAYNTPEQTAMPAGAKKGINYDFPNTGEVTLVLHTPTSTTYNYYDSFHCEGISSVGTTPAKQVVHVIGDFTGWEALEAYKMKVDGDYWWITLQPDQFTNPGQNEYVYQYLIDGNIRIGDPYSEKISDPDDQYISAEVYPGLIPYNVPNGRGTVLELNKTAYQWQIPDFQRQFERDDLNVYELHFRDFTPEGTYKAATAKLDYIADMGINTIHVMPISEFEGNNSWGYNPNYYFAADKAYGPENDLKEFIDEAHKRGIAVVNDLVLNHAFYTNPNAMMYWDFENNRPAPYNPWFNPVHKAVYDQAGHWGADWNHASEHTQQMVDDIISYWITEFKFDGFRFDFTKGFSQAEPDVMDPWASSYDVCRIDLLKRMADEMWTLDNSTIKPYVIFEHLANDDEDKALADHGILMWSGAGPQHSWAEMAMGTTTQSFWPSVYTSRNFNYPNYMSYMESHDEERIGYKVDQWGQNNDGTTSYLSNRLKLVAGFNMFLPGPRMVWQFGELGYDISIDHNGRTGEKPSAWELGYDSDAERQEIYNYYTHIFNFRNKFNLYNSVDYRNIGSPDQWHRSMAFNDGAGTYVITLGNFNTAADYTITPGFQTTGTWYRYNGDPAVDGTPFQVNNQSDTFTLYTNDPAYILSNKDIVPPVFNAEPVEITTDYCNFTLDDTYNIAAGSWTNGTLAPYTAADRNGQQITLELNAINGETTTANTISGFVPVSGENTFEWTATDSFGNSSNFTQSITVVRGECHKPGVEGIAAGSDILISTLNRQMDQMTTTKNNGLLVLESKSMALVISKIPLNETTDIITEPVEGMIVFDENENCLKLYDGTQWGCIQQKAIPIN